VRYKEKRKEKRREKGGMLSISPTGLVSYMPEQEKKE
jgi:preprotein translocase subunit Sec61beta